MDQTLFEERLQALLRANAEDQRFRRVTELKRQGKTIIGTLCASVPEEVIFSAGMVPFRITGTWNSSTPLASTYRPANTCGFVTHCLESLLNGQFDFLDGVVSTDWDDDVRRCCDVWRHVEGTKLVHMMTLPHHNSRLATGMFSQSVYQLKLALERAFDVEISNASLREAIDVYNVTRTLLHRIYELRKREQPPLSGAEVLALVTASFTMPKDEFNRELGALLPYIEIRKPPLLCFRPRILVTSDLLFHPGYLALIEAQGALVAMDDLDTGFRYFSGRVSDDGRPIQAIAERYLAQSLSPRAFHWTNYLRDHVAGTVRSAWHIDGVVNLPQRYSHWRLCCAPLFNSTMDQAMVPYATVEREYHLANQEQIKTRVGAFIESLSAEG